MAEGPANSRDDGWVASRSSGHGVGDGEEEGDGMGEGSDVVVLTGPGRGRDRSVQSGVRRKVEEAIDVGEEPYNDEGWSGRGAIAMGAVIEPLEVT